MIQLTDSIIAIEVPEDATEIHLGNHCLGFKSKIWNGDRDCNGYCIGYIELLLKKNAALIGVTPLSYETWCTEIFSSAYEIGLITHGNDIGVILDEKGLDDDKRYAIIKKEINNMETHNIKNK